MEVQLKELLDSIKKEGIETAEVRSKEIKDKAKEEAAAIVEAAKKDAEKIIGNAKSEAAKLEASGKAALEQAGRDLILSLKAAITDILGGIANADVSAAMNGKVLEEGILAVLKSWKEDVEDMSVLLDETSAKEIGKVLEARLAKELGRGVEVKPFSGIDKGFRITEKDGSGYYDFSASGLSDMICRFLNPRLEEIVKKALES